MSVLRSIFTTFAKFEVISKKNQKVKNTILLCVCNSLNCYLRLFIHLDLILTSNPFIAFSLAKFRILIGQLLSSSSFQTHRCYSFFHVSSMFENLRLTSHLNNAAGTGCSSSCFLSLRTSERAHQSFLVLDVSAVGWFFIFL